MLLNPFVKSYFFGASQYFLFCIYSVSFSIKFICIRIKIKIKPSQGRNTHSVSNATVKNYMSKAMTSKNYMSKAMTSTGLWKDPETKNEFGNQNYHSQDSQGSTKCFLVKVIL